MGPSPTIPTSFVPKQPVRTSQRFTNSGGNTFLVISIILLGVSLLSAAGVFAFERYLSGIQATKAAEVAAAEKKIDTDAVEEFIRMRDRFVAAEVLLDGHVVSSQFFDLLESITLQNVRFNSLSFKLAEDRTAEIHMDGIARTFNALAAQSSEFAEEKRIKRAIFSDITIDEDDDTVLFTLTAALSPALLSRSLEETTAPETVETVPEVPALPEGGVESSGSAVPTETLTAPVPETSP